MLYIFIYVYKKWYVKDKFFWIKNVRMDKKYNGFSVIYGKKSFDFVICYLVILYYDLDRVLDQVASSDLEVALLWKICAPQCERACGGPGKASSLKLFNKILEKYLRVIVFSKVNHFK